MSIEVDKQTQEKLPPDWSQFVAWAIESSDESWARIDTVIELVADDERYVLHAISNLKNENQYVRDLAASILEATSLELADETVVMLKEMLSDEHFYAKFRAACALIAHKAYGDHEAEVKSILQDALTDENQEIVAIAQQRLGELEGRKAV